MKIEVPYGEWNSPLTAEVAAQSGGGLSDVTFSVGGHQDSASTDPSELRVYWTESLPADDGRNAIMFSDLASGSQSQQPQEYLPSSLISARSRVNEYGGRAFWLCGDPHGSGDGAMWWVSADTQRIWTREGSQPPRAVTPRPPKVRGWRYAAGVCTDDGRWSVVEMERHFDESGTELAEAANDIVAVGAESATPIPLVHEGVEGWGDFVGDPKLSPDGNTLVWLRWDHPDMPWDAAELWAARFTVESGVPQIHQPRRIAGGYSGGISLGLDRAVSVCLVEFSPDGRLWWCDDSAEYWHLRYADTVGLPPEGSGDGAARLVPDPREEVGSPRWVSGGSRYGFVNESTVVFAAMADGLESVWVYDVTTGSRRPLPGPSFTYVQSLAVSGSDVAIIGGAADIATSVYHVDLVSDVARDLRSAALPIAPEWISAPVAIEVAGPGASHCHALFYPPVSGSCRGADGELPPLLVRIHGGPTAAARPEFTTSIQFWTTRGFAVAEVNYRGSTGYGRKYRDELRGSWGVADVEDCLSVARQLASQGLVDPKRCVIRGGSAGGFTALAALCFQHQWGFDSTFAAACSLYGVTDLAALTRDTHKFESRYLDGLVGEYPAQAETYDSRSPLHHADQLVEPVLILQGAEDRILPPSQAEVLVDAMAARGVPHAYILFQGEGHGFQQHSTIVTALETELGFYGQVLGFDPVGGIGPL